MLSATKIEEVRAIFNGQGAMRMLGARIANVGDGVCEFDLDFRPELSQQAGFFHAGIVSTLIDTAGGCAGFTKMPEGTDVLTVEFKLNLIAPASGEKIIARAEVIKAGRTLTITQGKVFSVHDGKETLCALMQQTLINVPKK
ncbi:MAG: PaaI family thioesterase [Casimicrobium sp.]